MGRLVATALRGKDAESLVEAQATASDPTFATVYHRYADHVPDRPAQVWTLLREMDPPNPTADPAPATRPPPVVKQQVQYFDGLGRVALAKASAAPETSTSPPRWVGTGRVVYDAKVRPVGQYEPYFTTLPFRSAAR